MAYEIGGWCVQRQWETSTVASCELSRSTQPHSWQSSTVLCQSWKTFNQWSVHANTLPACLIHKHRKKHLKEKKERKNIYICLAAPYPWCYARIVLTWLTLWLSPVLWSNSHQNSSGLPPCEWWLLRVFVWQVLSSGKLQSLWSPGLMKLRVFLVFSAQLRSESEHGGSHSCVHPALALGDLLPPPKPSFSPSPGTAFICHSLHVLQCAGSTCLENSMVTACAALVSLLWNL